MGGELKLPSSAVTVWMDESLFFHTTSVPAFTFITSGEKAIWSIRTRGEEVTEVFDALSGTQHFSFSVQSRNAPCSGFSLGAHTVLHFPPSWVAHSSLASANAGNNTRINIHFMLYTIPLNPSLFKGRSLTESLSSVTGMDKNYVFIP